jgi:hypothetical protein
MHLVGFIIEIYHDARSQEREICYFKSSNWQDMLHTPCFCNRPTGLALQDEGSGPSRSTGNI